ncbi:efflux RND transporter permease subunit [Planococcus glaciei]|uniref:efflux RND transporter permease subunit n=1 Tax=Planococcus glaciei TaxID=459472 RepID=UPI0003DF2CFC|nr:efflux RND transporter permease subunit [Planococcus glaciei]ETP67596.1 Swarming motility protein SwrC [Planococcus glaciei CHR43]MBX0313408.1 efflux RND transporter permease subunit [Planococcus glaciei]
MKKIIDFSLNNKFAIWILTLMVVIAGLYSGLTMKQESIPSITLPALTVIAPYPGAAPDEIVEELTIPMEQRIQNMNGVELVTSSSLANAATIQVQYTFETDMDEAARQVETALSELSLPEGASEPEVSRLSLDAFPILTLSISEPGKSLEELTTTVEENVLPQLEGVEGLSDAQISGQRVQKVTMTFNEEKMAQYGMTPDTIQQLIQGSNLSFPLGLTNFDGELKNLVIDGNVTTVDDLKALQIPAVPQQAAGGAPTEMPPGQDPTAAAGAEQGQVPPAAPGMSQGQNPAAAAVPPVTQVPTVALSELADIEVVSEAESISRTNGEESIGIQVVKSPEANTVEVANAVKDIASDLEKDYGLNVATTFDQAEPIEQSVETMLSKALFGILFAVVIILIFLRSFKTTIISIISIPLSLLMAIFLLNQMDITLNIMTLGALTVAIGRVIDDSIVVIENIYRRMALPGERLRGKELIREATREMFIPIFSSTVVTIAVFLPLALVDGQIGELFLPFALAVVFALSASLLVAVTIVPMMAHSMYGKQLQNLDAANSKQKEHKPGKLANGYRRILEWTLNHKIVTFGGATVLLVASLFLVPVIGVSFLPEEEQKMVMATYSPEPGQTLENVEQIALDAESLIDGRDGVTTYQYSLGGDSPMAAFGGGSNSALFFIEYDDEFENFSTEGDKLIEELNGQTGTGEWAALDFSATGSSGIETFVYGDSIEDIQTAIDQIQPLMEENDGLEKVESSLTEAYDQYTLVADQEKLGAAGLTAAQIGMALSGTGEAPVLTTVKHENKDINVYVEVAQKDYAAIGDVTDVEIPTALGTTVAIGDVMTVEEGKSPDTIDRRDGQMYASLTADVTGNNAAEITADIDAKTDELDLPSGVSIDHGGVTEQINESFTQLGLAMLAAIAIVYFVLVVTFGGALAPFAILFSLPFTVIGVLVALWISGEALSVNALIGVLMLIGIVVTNAIVLVDRVIHKEKEGFTTREALLEAGSTRLRPILMTALATIGALIPLAIGAEGGGLISKGLGITVIGGLTSSTLLTLVIVPIVYEVVAKFRKKQVN